MVPRDMALVKLETEGGNVDAFGLTGRVEAESGGGSMHLDDIGGGVSAETGGGSIDVGTVSGDMGDCTPVAAPSKFTAPTVKSLPKLAAVLSIFSSSDSPPRLKLAAAASRYVSAMAK